MGGGKPGYLNKRFGPDWKQRDKFFKEFEEQLTQEIKAQS